jgi:TPR repeat protein
VRFSVADGRIEQGDLSLFSVFPYLSNENLRGALQGAIRERSVGLHPIPPYPPYPQTVRMYRSHTNMGPARIQGGFAPHHESSVHFSARPAAEYSEIACHPNMPKLDWPPVRLKRSFKLSSGHVVSEDELLSDALKPFVASGRVGSAMRTSWWVIPLLLIGVLPATAQTDSDAKVVAKVLAKAKAGDAGAQFNLGTFYAYGAGVPKNETQAAIWFRKAAVQGDALAQVELGVAYERGNGVPQDYAQAAVWYRKAGEQGYADAQYNLGLLYAFGQGVPQDYAQAAVWYRRAAMQGYADAQYNLGLLYAFGQGVPQDYAQAAVWYRKAAEQGEARAQVKLGVSYAVGQGVPQDDGKAAVWYRKAAEQGNAGAQQGLGMAYDNGLGVPQDYAEAYFWYDLALAGKLDADMRKLAESARDAAAQHLSPADLTQVQARATRWFAQHRSEP